MYLIAIFEDDQPLREAIVNYLNVTRTFHCLFNASKISDLTSLKPDIVPDIILLDVHLEEGPSINYLRSLTEHFAASRIVIMTGDTRDELLLQAIEQGVQGYILKPFTMTSLVQTLEAVLANDTFLSPDLVKKLMKTLAKRNNQEAVMNDMGLTAQQKKIMSLLKDGLTYKAIASNMNLSYHTINQHIKNIYKKLNVSSRFELINLHQRRNYV